MPFDIKHPPGLFFGGKWDLASWIISQFPPTDWYSAYSENYGGLGSVLIQSPVTKLEYYNDRSRRLVNFLRIIRNHIDDLTELLDFTSYSRTEFERCLTPCPRDPVEDARRVFVVLNQGIRGTLNGVSGWRRHLKAESRYSMEPGVFRDRINSLIAISDRLMNVYIECCDALELMEELDSPTTLHYLDPTYVKSTRKDKNNYHTEMTDDDHRRMAEVANDCSGFVVISGYQSKLYDELFGDWRLVKKEAKTKGKKKVECLWMNYDAPGRLL